MAAAGDEAAKESKLPTGALRALPPPLLYLYATVKTHIKEVYGWRFIAGGCDISMGVVSDWIHRACRGATRAETIDEFMREAVADLCRAAIGATGPLVDSARRPWSSAAHLRPRVEQSVGPQSIGHPEYPEYPESISLLFS